MAETPEAAEPQRVTLLGEQHAVTLPDFAAREELLVAYGDLRHRRGVAVLRVYAAAIGLCTRIGRRSEADFARHRFDVLAYGGEVYGWLRERKATPEQIAQAALPIICVIGVELYPREVEVDAAAGNSEGAAVA